MLTHKTYAFLDPKALPATLLSRLNRAAEGELKCLTHAKAQGVLKMARTAVKKRRKTKRGLAIALTIVCIIAVIAAVVVFGVYRGMHIVLKAELGEGAPDASAFMKDGSKASYVGDSDVSLTEEGTYLLTVKSDSASRKVVLIVRDTMAPQTEAKDISLTIDDKTLAPEDALTEIKDASEYTVAWKTEPIYGTAGSYDCAIELKDSHGNGQTIKTTIKVLGAIDVLTHEAGTPRPTLKDFMVVERDNAELLTDLGSIDWTKLGDNTVEIKFDNTTYTSILRIVDTTAPVPDLVPVAVKVGGEVTADSFAVGCDDATEVKYELASKPDTSKKGSFDVDIKAADAAGNEAEVKGKLIVCDDIVEFEASTDTLSESAVRDKLGADYAGYTMETEPFMLNSLGAHEVKLTKDGVSKTVGVNVKDTTAPTADGIKCECSTGYYCEPIKFLENINDVSTVKASFVTEPDWDTEGEQEVEIILTDRAGNSTTVKATAVISPDKTAPTIYAARDRYCYVGEAVAYFKEVFAVDNADPEPELTVDKSKVNAKKVGEYDVTYTAKDHEGNSSSVTVKFKFIENKVTDEMLDAEVNKVLDRILTDDMSLEKQAYAIFDYVYSNVLYTGDSDKTDWKAEAYRGLTKGVGDCFTFYSTTYALLQKIDCQVLSVERLNGRTQHFWCLVNLGTGWYHFDACNVGPQHLRCFMKTSEELVQYSVQYWRFDTSLYPQVETRPYVMEN